MNGHHFSNITKLKKKKRYWVLVHVGPLQITNVVPFFDFVMNLTHWSSKKTNKNNRNLSFGFSKIVKIKRTLALGDLKTFKEMVVFMEELANNQICKGRSFDLVFWEGP